MKPISVSVRHVRWMIALCFVLTVLSMFAYPGGTPLHKSTTGYSLTHNFLSDLGMTVSYSGESNRIGAALFVASLLLLVISGALSIIKVVSLLSRNPPVRQWTRVAAVFTLLAGIAFTGVAFTPENSAMSAHMAFTRWGWRFVPLVAACVGMALLRTNAVSRRLMTLWWVVTVLLLGYVVIITWGPSVTTETGLMVQVVAQKAAAAVFVYALFLLSTAAKEGGVVFSAPPV